MFKLASFPEIIRLLCSSPKIIFIGPQDPKKFNFDCIITVPLGQNNNPLAPTKSNREIERVGRRFGDQYPTVPRFTQGKALHPMRRKDDAHTSSEYEKLSLSQFFAWLHKTHPEWKTIACITHPDYLGLCSLIAKKFELTLVAPSSVHFIPYDPHAPDWQVRSRLAFLFTRSIAVLQMISRGVI